MSEDNKIRCWVIMRSFATVLAVVVVCGGTARADNADSAANRWASTELNLEVAGKFINNSKCTSSLAYLESCVAAISAANKLIPNPVSLIGNAVNFEKTLREIGEALPPEVPLQLMLADAINAHLKKFDAHAYLMPTETFKNNDGYTGLGLNVRKVTQGFLVTEVIENTAAEKAKVSFGDLITHIDGIEDKEFFGFSIVSLAKALRGPAGAAISLRIDRNGSSRDIKVVRAKVESKTVTFGPLPSDGSTGYIRIRDFVAGQTCTGVKKALRAFEASRVTKLILDLRANPGGNTREAVCIAGLFTGFEEVVGVQSVELQVPKNDLFPMHEASENVLWLRGFSMDANSMPLAVLVDGASASAAEILAGSLQSLKRAWLVGERTFGKGTQQTITSNPSFPGLTLAATTERVILPNQMSHQKVGLTPSFPVEVVRGAEGFGNFEDYSEATLYPTSLEAINTAWTDPRTEEISAIRSCISRGGWDQKFLTALGPANPDYQKAYAAAVLKCNQP